MLDKITVALKDNPRNPRKISEEQKMMLKKSLQEFGDLSGIVFNRKSGVLVGGHQRIHSLPEQPYITISARYPEGSRTGTVAEGFIEIEGEKHKYREVEWDDVKEKAAMIAANKQGGEWDFPGLTELITELDAENIDLDLIGFEDKELENFMTWSHKSEPDYSALEGAGIDGEIADMAGEVRKAIQIDFAALDYGPAMELVSEARKRGVYVGGILIQALRDAAV